MGSNKCPCCGTPNPELVFCCSRSQIQAAIRSPHCETETLARLETVVEEGSHVQPTVDTVKRAVKVEVTWAENVKVEPVEAGGDSRSSIICIPPTMEEQLMRRIVAGKDELLSAKAMLARHKSVEEELYMSYRVWDLRSERLRKEHELELAITSHFVVTKGDVGNESHHAIRELIAEVRMIEASRKVHGSYSALRAKRAEVLNQERAIKTLARVLEGWESKFDERVQDLLGELQKGGDYDRAA
ncbi:hypothetical protein KC19_VG223500 [Ceratodon purpureus]|uniref:Uncharacterized protein n=1 Tax=Ceratodon purpureus TaxID=3225 RepID=A0A8T0HSK2_CERPU|nr:hypothetical protein KC19_VG223500 [Ceratodon purpureus]